MSTARKFVGYWTGGNLLGTVATVRTSLAAVAECERRAFAALSAAAPEIARQWYGRPAPEGLAASESRLSGDLSVQGGGIRRCHMAAEQATTAEDDARRQRSAAAQQGARLALGIAARLAALSGELQSGQHAGVLSDLCALAERLPVPVTGTPTAERAVLELSTLAAALDVEGGR